MAQGFPSELAQFFNHALRGGVSIGTVGHGLVERVEDVMEAGQQLGPVRQALFERAGGLGSVGGQGRFIVHQPFYLYSG